MATIVKAAEPRKTSNHFGGVGDRIRIEGVIRKMIGNKPVMHIVEDIDGNQFIVRRNSALGSKPGVLVTIEAEVLEHRTYQDIKQTVLSAGRQEIVTDQHAFGKDH
jgi:hypothetical protein